MSRRRIIAVITLEVDERGQYYAHADFAPTDPISIGPWHTLLGCLDGIGRRLLDFELFPRAIRRVDVVDTIAIPSNLHNPESTP